jgi:outer membrane protein TolC
MIKRFEVIMIIAALGSGIMPLKAQDTITLSLNDAMDYAIQHNKTLVNAKYNIDKTKQKNWEITASGLPQVSSAIDYTNYLGAEISFSLSESAPAATIPFNPTSNFKVNVSQLVFNGSYFVGLQLAKLSLEASQLNYQKSETDVKEQVTRAYYLVLVAERTLNILAANISNAQNIYQKTYNLYKTGIIEKSEADKLSVMVATIENSQKAAERQLEMAYNLLRLNLGLEAGQPLILSDKLDDISDRVRFQSAVDGSFDINNNFDYKLILSQERLLTKQVSFEKANYFPTIAGFYSHTEKILKPKFDMTPKNVIGLSATVPIFSSGLKRSRVSQAKTNQLIISNTRELLDQQISLQEKQARFNLNNLMEQYETQKKNMGIAKEVYENMSLKYEQGIVSSLELTSANSNYMSAEAGFTNVLFQLLDAELTLRKINGKL